MKAMSLDLIRGSIDEVEEIVHVHWILPRYLSRNHVEIMVRKLGEWGTKLEEVTRQVEGQSQELVGHHF
jgi:26S proteasome regulatory subunit N9